MLEYKKFYLVGIKGVAMTALAQCLTDAGKSVQGSDVPENFVTEKMLGKLRVKIDTDFQQSLPDDIECVIYTGAHQAQQNPQVVEAQARGLALYSQAAAIAELFNQKKGVAVCGVGGKSTTSAMITWILEKTHKQPSYLVGVGEIPGLDRTGRWSNKSEVFVAEADEYVVDPSAPSRGEPILPKFWLLHPFVTVCTNLKFDHPDVYKSFEQTQEVYQKFFDQIQPNGKLIVKSDDRVLLHIAQEVGKTHPSLVFSFGEHDASDLLLETFVSQPGLTKTKFIFQGVPYELTLQIPGKYNALNGLAAICAAYVLGIPMAQSIQALADFRSTMRRAEFIGEKNGIKFYDDYAHHPDEVAQVIHAFREWFPSHRLVVAFQSHTFSRTKALFKEFTQAFGEASEVVMIDIFASARETADPSVSSDALCEAIHHQFPQVPAQNFKTLENLAQYLKQSLKSGDVCLTIGAGDIYHVHEWL